MYNYQMRVANSRYDTKIMYDISASSRDPHVQEYSRYVDWLNSVERSATRQILKDHTSRLTLGSDAVPESVSYTSMFGNYGKVFDAMSSFVPVFGGVANFAKFARQGNAPMAVLNLAVGISEFAGFGVTGASSEAATVANARGLVYDAGATASKGVGPYKGVGGLPIAQGQNIAFGLNDDLFAFAKTNGFQTYRDFSVGFQEDKILSAINNPNNNLHFNLTGFSKIQYSRFNPEGFINHGNITNWELNTILTSPGALERTTFYKFSNGSYNIVSNPFK